MKKPFLFVLLLIIPTLLLTSCNPIASNSEKTGSFQFKISDEMIATISRSGSVTDSTLCTMKLHLVSTDGISYDHSLEKTSSLSQLKGYTFPSFTGIPFDKEMNLTVEVKADGKLIFSSLNQTFTVPSNNAHMTLHVQMQHELDTPYVLVLADDEDSLAGTFLFLTPETSFSDETDNLIPLSYNQKHSSYVREPICCFDQNGAMWFQTWETDEEDPDNQISYIAVTDSNGLTTQTVINSDLEDEEYFTIDAMVYDPVKNKVFMICDIWSEENGVQYYAAHLNQDAYLAWGNMAVIPRDEMLPLDSEISDYLTNLSYAYNGYLYVICTFSPISTKESYTVPIIKFALEDKDGFHAGDLVKTGTVSIPRVREDLTDEDFIDGYIGEDYYLNGDSDEFHFAFNDMAVYDDSIYILFHQKEIWSYPQPNLKYGSSTEYEFNRGLTSGGYIDRGGILVVDADTLATTDTLGLNDEIMDELQLPLIVDAEYRHIEDGNTVTDGYIAEFLYEDDSLTTVAMTTIPITVLKQEETSEAIRFSNPMKIVAIKPKKLVIADTGLFYYIDPDKDENGKPVVKEVEGTNVKEFIHTKQETRLITVDLENFSNSTVTTVLTDETNPVYNYDLSSTDEIKTLIFNCYPAPGTYYYPKVEFTAPNTFQLIETVGVYEQDENTTYGGSGFVCNTQIILPF